MAPMTPDTLSAHLSACFDDEESIQQVTECVAALSSRLKRLIVTSITTQIDHEITIEDRVKVCRIIEHIRVNNHSKHSVRDKNVLTDLSEAFCVVIENEEGWGSDDDYVKDDKDQELAVMKNAIASRIVATYGNIKEHGNVRSSARDSLNEMHPVIVRLVYDKVCSNDADPKTFASGLNKLYDELDESLDSFYKLVELAGTEE